MEQKLILCENCRKLRTQYIKAYQFCQTCYRELLDEYSYFDYKTPKEKLRGNAKQICELLIEQGANKLEIYKMLNLNKVYVQQIINKHTNRVDKNGNIRPF